VPTYKIEIFYREEEEARKEMIPAVELWLKTAMEQGLV
jgi:hypothetical protein